MFIKLRNAYITDRNYLALYLNGFFKQTAFFIYALFEGSWLYTLGLPLHVIIALHAASFALMGLTAPLGFKLVIRHGILKTEIIGNSLVLTAAFLLSLTPVNPWFALVSMLVCGFAHGLVNPLWDIIQAIYIEDHNRGKNFTLMMALTSAAMIAGIALSGWLITMFSFYGIAALCGVLITLGTIPFIFLDERVKGTTDLNFKKLYTQPFQKEFRPYFLAFFGENFSVIGRVVFVPVILILYAKDFQVMAYIVALAVSIETILLLAFGHWIDKTHKSTPLHWATFVNAGALVFYGFFAKTPISLLIADSAHRLGHNLFTSSFCTLMHSYIRKTKPSLIIFGTGWQMSICFWEVVSLSIFSVISFIFGIQSLPYLMLACGAGLFFACWQANKLTKQKK